jgi:hypothetical protein
MPIVGPGCRNASARVRRLVGEPRHHRQRSRASRHHRDTVRAINDGVSAFGATQRTSAKVSFSSMTIPGRSLKRPSPERHRLLPSSRRSISEKAQSL